MEAARPTHHAQSQGFNSTHWTTVRACASKGTIGWNAREKLCRDYWYPVYAWLRRSGQTVGEPEDLTQDFFAYILRRPWFIRADQNKGKFRSFLLGSLENFLKDQQKHRNALKRGADLQHISYDLAEARLRYADNERLQASISEIYDFEWTTALAERALERLRNDYVTTGRIALYDELKPFLATLGSSAAYQASAQTLGITADNFKISVHRLRQSYRVALREEVAQTVSNPEDVDDEMRYIQRAFAAL